MRLKLRDWEGGGGGYKTGGEACEALPYEKGAGGGGEKSFSHAEGGGGHNKFLGSFYEVLAILKGGGVQKVSNVQYKTSYGC